MEIKKNIFKVALGYETVERVRSVDIFTACDILRSGKQKHITTARRVGDGAELVSHYIKCPHCGNEAPSYAHFLNTGFSATPKRSEKEISEWADIQGSFFSEPDAYIGIQECRRFCGEYICEKCGYSSGESSGYTDLYVEYTDNKLWVKREIKNLTELVTLKWLSSADGVGFPLCEWVEFDFCDGTTRLKLTCDDKLLCSVNITDSDKCFKNDKLLEIISKNYVVKRNIRRFIQGITGFGIPFATKELSIDKFVDFTRFQGFSRDFYSAIPFWGGTRVVDESFGEITRSLRNPESAMRLLEKSSIPCCKSVKRLFVKRSGLFFYIEECEFIYSLFNDVNLFCSFLKGELVFHFLAMLHYYGNSVKIFLADYSKVLGKVRFANRFRPNDDIIRYGIFYASLSDYVREKEREKWIAGVDVFDDFNILSYRVNHISVPLYRVGNNMKNMVIDKYRFEYLRTKRECVATGEKMKNCLVNGDSFSNPVVVVYKGDKITAAIEIFEKTLEQAKKCANQPIKPGSEIFCVIEKWCKKNNIICDADKFDGAFMW